MRLSGFALPIVWVAPLLVQASPLQLEIVIKDNTAGHALGEGTFAPCPERSESVEYCQRRIVSKDHVPDEMLKGWVSLSYSYEEVFGLD